VEVDLEGLTLSETELMWGGRRTRGVRRTRGQGWRGRYHLPPSPPRPCYARSRAPLSPLTPPRFPPLPPLASSCGRLASPTSRSACSVSAPDKHLDRAPGGDAGGRTQRGGAGCSAQSVTGEAECTKHEPTAVTHAPCSLPTAEWPSRWRGSTRDAAWRRRATTPSFDTLPAHGRPQLAVGADAT
jgi:hypothetical protein